MITIVNFVIATIVISFCVSTLISCYLYKVLKDHFEDKVERLEEKISAIEGRYSRLEDIHLEHVVKYH